jgi:hypothetical protein
MVCTINSCIGHVHDGVAALTAEINRLAVTATLN